RKSKNGLPVYVQLQAGRNPGNSGGPVVDADGRLVGIWVGSFEGTQIGLALAPPLLDALLKRTKAHIDATTIKSDAEEIEMEFKVEVFDLLGEMKEVRLLYAPGAQLPNNPPALDAGEYAAIPNSRTLNLKGSGKQFSGRLTIANREVKYSQLPVQLAYVRRDGSVHYGKPWNQRIGPKSGGVALNPAAPATPSGPADVTIDLPGKMESVAVGGA